MKRFSRILLFLFIAPAVAAAHHGRDFLVTSSYKTPERGDLFGIVSTDYVRFNHHGESGYEFSPALLYGLTDAWSIEMHSHHGIGDGGVGFASIACESMIRLIGGGREETDARAPFSLALLGEYGKGMNETPDAAEGRVVLGKELGIAAAAVNLIVQKEFEDDADVEVRFAGGLRMSVVPWFGAGLEFESSEGESAGALLTPGVYTALSDRLDVRLGASIGVEHGTLNALRSQLIYAF